jgi:hypothetical protein
MKYPFEQNFAPMMIIRLVYFEMKIPLILNAQDGYLLKPHDDYTQSGNLLPGGAISSI